MAESSAQRVAVLLTATAIGLAACGGSGSPHVASLPTPGGNGNGGSTPTTSRSTRATVANGNPTQLLDEWTSCMHRHGDPNLADPTVDANKVIHITWNPATPGGIYGTNKGGQGNSGPGQYCRAYLSRAQGALGGDQSSEQPDPTQLLRFSQCMRDHGVPDFPDPTGDNLSIRIGSSSDLNPDNPVFQRASKLCAHKTGLPGLVTGTPRPGMIELDGSGPGEVGGLAPPESNG